MHTAKSSTVLRSLARLRAEKDRLGRGMMGRQRIAVLEYCAVLGVRMMEAYFNPHTKGTESPHTSIWQDTLILLPR